MAWLTVDRGNTTLDCQLESRRARLAVDATELDTFVGAVELDGVAAATVVADGLAPIVAWCRSRGLPLLRAGTELACPLRTDYREFGQLGVDRWVAAVAGRERFGDSVIADAGTALTVDAVFSDGRFVAGAIAPGLRAMRDGLAALAPELPIADVRSVGLPARDSEHAVSSGVVLGFVAQLEGLVDRVRAAAGMGDAPVVLTGGDAELVIEHSNRAFRFEPDLVHAGLRCLLNRHESNC